MKSPHILLAATNVSRMRDNLAHILDSAVLALLEREINANVAGLFDLGVSHYNFANGLNATEWRQIVSRLYYGAYNIQRAVRLSENGVYSTDVSDHKKVDEIPVRFPNAATYRTQFPALRTDRNLCDYDHSAVEADLLMPVADWKALVSGYVTDARAYLIGRGVGGI